MVNAYDFGVKGHEVRAGAYISSICYTVYQSALIYPVFVFNFSFSAAHRLISSSTDPHACIFALQFSVSMLRFVQSVLCLRLFELRCDEMNECVTVFGAFKTFKLSKLD